MQANRRECLGFTRVSQCGHDGLGEYNNRCKPSVRKDVEIVNRHATGCCNREARKRSHGVDEVSPDGTSKKSSVHRADFQKTLKTGWTEGSTVSVRGVDRTSSSKRRMSTREGVGPKAQQCFMHRRYDSSSLPRDERTTATDYRSGESMSPRVLEKESTVPKLDISRAKMNIFANITLDAPPSKEQRRSREVVFFERQTIPDQTESSDEDHPVEESSQTPQVLIGSQLKQTISLKGSQTFILPPQNPTLPPVFKKTTQPVQLISGRYAPCSSQSQTHQSSSNSFNHSNPSKTPPRPSKLKPQSPSTRSPGSYNYFSKMIVVDKEAEMRHELAQQIIELIGSNERLLLQGDSKLLSYLNRAPGQGGQSSSCLQLVDSLRQDWINRTHNLRTLFSLIHSLRFPSLPQDLLQTVLKSPLNLNRTIDLASLQYSSN